MQMPIQYISSVHYCTSKVINSRHVFFSIIFACYSIQESKVHSYYAQNITYNFNNVTYKQSPYLTVDREIFVLKNMNSRFNFRALKTFRRWTVSQRIHSTYIFRAFFSSLRAPNESILAAKISRSTVTETSVSLCSE